ncbi:MAG TPA: GNAT family N-acetyltransferase [Nitrospira sp.]|nr:GNAT family N-acetyltransferase [Nitrospira sp.]
MDSATVVRTVPDPTPTDHGAAAVIATSDAPDTGLHVELVQDEPTFLSMESVWNRLVDEAGLDHPFIRHEWIRTWWECFQPAGMLHILIVKRGQEPVAIAPLMLDRGRLYGCPVRRLRGIANVYTERFDLILSRDPKECCGAIWRFLAARAAQWDVLELRQIPEGSHVDEHLLLQAFEDKFLLGQWPSSQGPYVTLDQPWEAYWKGLSKRHTSNLRGREKGLHRVGEVQCEIVRGGEALSEAITEAFLLEAAAWKGRAGTAIMSRPERAAFYRQVLHRSAERGWTRLFFLTVNGKRIAVQLALLLNQKLYILKSGYDPLYAQFAPSLVLCGLMLREAWKEGLREVDFMGDPERWKMEWATKTRAHSWLFIFPNRPRLRLLHRLKFIILPRMHQHPLYRAAKFAGRRLGLTLHRD